MMMLTRSRDAAKNSGAAASIDTRLLVTMRHQAARHLCALCASARTNFFFSRRGAEDAEAFSTGSTAGPHRDGVKNKRGLAAIPLRVFAPSREPNIRLAGAGAA